MVSWSDLRCFASAAGALLPFVKVAAGIWFVSRSAEILWRLSKPLFEYGRRARPKFASGRVEKFYKFTPPRVKRRMKCIKRKGEGERRKTRMKSETVTELHNEQEPSTIMEDEVDMTKLVRERFYICSSDCCTNTTSPTEPQNEEVETDDVNNNVGKGPCTTDATEIHNKVVNDLGLMCLPSDVLEDHNHVTNSPRDHQEVQLPFLPEECAFPLHHPRTDFLPSCLSTSELQKTSSSTPFVPATCQSAVVVPTRPVACLLGTFSLTAPPLIPPTDRLLSCGSLHALPLSDEELGEEEVYEEKSASGENLASILDDTKTTLFEVTLEAYDKDESKTFADSQLKLPEAISNIYGVFSPIASSGVEKSGDVEVGVYNTDDDANISKVSVECCPKLNIEDLFNPSENSSTPTVKVENVEVSPKEIDDVSSPDITYVEGYASSDEIEVDLPRGNFKEDNLYIHISK